MTTTAIMTAAATKTPTTTATTRVRKNLLGLYPPQSVSKQISDLLRDDKFTRIYLSPCYQRHIKWSLDAMCDFIGTVMNNGLVPNIYTYNLQESETQNGKYDTEVMDGQHRLYTLKAFMDSVECKSTHIKKTFIPHWRYETIDEKGHKYTQRVFYKQTDELENWFNRTYPDEGAPYYLTAEEKRQFDDFTLNVTTIYNKLSMDSRREIFLSLQKGVRVCNSDLIKNMTTCKLISKFEVNNYQKRMSTFTNYCSKKAYQYWTQWAARCYLLFVHSTEKESKRAPFDVFRITDPQIKKDITNGNKHYNPTDEQFAAFDGVFSTFIKFLEGQNKGTLFNPTQIFTLFYHLCSSDCDLDILKSHMPNFYETGQKNKEVKGLWESKAKIEQRKVYFNDCLSELKAMTETYLDTPIDKKPISPKLRKKVFAKTEARKCDTCKREITFEKFHAGHIKARAKKGKTVIENLVPLCKDCNLGMRTQTPEEYENTFLPLTRLD
jgi:hypothetical protein